MTCSSPQQVWDGVLRRLREALPSFAVDAWLAPLTAEWDGERLVLKCPTPLHQRRVEERYRAELDASLAAELGRVGPLPVDLRVVEPAAREASRVSGEAPRAVPTERASRPLRSPGSATPAAQAPATATAVQPELLYSFDSFVVGEGNALAREASWTVACGGSLPRNTLYLASGTGLGKTHLARAVVSKARARGCRAHYVHAERFTNELMEALRERRVDAFKQRYRRRCELLVVDDVPFLAGKPSTQDELFYTLENLCDEGSHVVLTGDQLPRELERFDPRLASRLACGLIADIEPPGLELRRAILRDKAARGGVRVPAECLEQIAEAVTGSVRELEAVLAQVVSIAAIMQQPIDGELTQGVLRKVLPATGPAQGLDPETVIEEVARFFGTTRAELAARSRRKQVMTPRKLAMYFCHLYTEASLTQIGSLFARSHPAVANAVASVERALLGSPQFRYKVEVLGNRLDQLARGAAGRPRGAAIGPISKPMAVRRPAVARASAAGRGARRGGRARTTEDRAPGR